METVKTGTAMARSLSTLRQWIKDGHIESGVPLPSERVLSARLDVNPRTLRRAIAVLEDEGVLLRKGPRVRMVSRPKPDKAEDSFLNDSVLLLSGELTPFKFDRHPGDGWAISILRGCLIGISRGGMHSMNLNMQRLHDSLTSFLGQAPGGMIVACDPAPLPPIEELKLAQSAKIPMSIYGNDPEIREFDRVASDHLNGSYELTKLALAAGKRRIMRMASFSNSATYWQEGRRAGFIKAMSEAGIQPMPELSEHQFSNDSAQSARQRWEMSTRYNLGCLVEYFAANGRPEVIMAQSDGDVFSIAAACRILGIEPGRDIEICGYDNYWKESAELQFEHYEPFATVDKLNLDIGLELADLMLKRKEGSLPPEPQLRLLKPRLLVRQIAEHTIKI